ncbi:MAG TPA: hypothetical protein VFU99_10865 [Gaiellaceae bacterium]|nr:hypothetical protein [Gaiellaceae bacterium]
METWEWIVLAAGLAALLVLFIALVTIRRRRAHLKERFGPEYDRAVSDVGLGSAEKRLTQAEREYEDVRIRPLPTAARERYLEEWRQAEARFVADPGDAARLAERLVERVLEERGYPTAEDDPDRRLTLVAVDHPDVVERYRHGRAMVDGEGEGRTENLRKAMIDFRTVLEDLLEEDRTAA